MEHEKALLKELAACVEQARRMIRGAEGLHRQHGALADSLQIVRFARGVPAPDRPASPVRFEDWLIQLVTGSLSCDGERI